MFSSDQSLRTPVSKFNQQSNQPKPSTHTHDQDLDSSVSKSIIMGLAKRSYCTDGDTCDERTRIIGQSPVDGKPEVDDNSNDSVVDNQTSKMASYLLEVQEISALLQQPNQSKQQSQEQVKKVLNKISIASTARHAKQTQLMLYGSVYLGQDSNSIERCGYIWDQHVGLDNIKIPVHEITKVKCLMDQLVPGRRKLKLVHNYKHSFLFSAGCDQSESGFSEHYLWFSKLITNKMEQIPFLIKKSSLASTPPKNVGKVVIMEGPIYKKSKYLMSWQPRYVLITDTEMLSYKDTSMEPTFRIAGVNIRYIWTRFDLYNGQLIIKVKDGMGQTEFAIPVMDFAGETNGNWLYAFYRLMSHSHTL